MPYFHTTHVTPTIGTFLLLVSPLIIFWQQKLHAGMRAKMSPPEKYILSPRVWKEQWGLGHLVEVSFDDVA